jgi:putative ABC transport system permease protein
MMRLDEINYALQNVMHRKLRSFLTVLSILIGITAIFALVSFGLGIQSYVNNLAAESGTDKLFVQSKGIGAPGTDSTFFISKDDINFISKISGVKEITGIYMKAGEIKFKDKKKFNFVMGADIDKIKFVEETMSLKIDSGRGLKKGEADKVVLGYNYKIADKIFPKGIKTGDTVEINSKPFTVVGFYSEIGNPQDDANIYMTKEGFEGLFPDSKDEYGFVLVRNQPDITTKDLADRITEKLRKHKGQDKGKEDFFVQTFEDALKTFQTIITIINGILFLIALISVVVASVNIMNTMYTAVLERTNEIGIMKAVGARNSDILFVFIFESGLLGMMGGILGVILGYIVASTGGGIAAASGYALLHPIFPWYLVVSCIMFAFLIGAGAGVLPAVRASRLKPVEALRYE